MWAQSIYTTILIAPMCRRDVSPIEGGEDKGKIHDINPIEGGEDRGKDSWYQYMLGWFENFTSFIHWWQPNFCQDTINECQHLVDISNFYE